MSIPLSLFCADQMTVFDQVTYSQNEGPEITKKWGGPVEIDLSQTEVPLVGKTDPSLSDQYRLQNYLADYFEGTALYDQKPIDPTNKEDLRRVFLAGGVFRKLAPKDYQDKLRENMINRALGRELRWSGPDDPVNDYVVVYVKNGEIVNPGTPDSEPIHLSDFADRLRPQRIDFPEGKVGDKQYFYAMRDWKKIAIKGVVLPKLWLYIPMFSREDAPGRIELKLKKEYQDDSLTFTGAAESLEIKVPHLARLKEVNEQIAKILSPVAAKFTAWRGPVIAQPQNQPQSLAEVLAISTNELAARDWQNYALQNDGDKIYGELISAHLEATEVFQNPNYKPLPTPTPPAQPCDPPECFTDEDCKHVPWGDVCLYDCCLPQPQPGSGTYDVSRKIDVRLKIPFLDQIWQNTVSGAKAIFKIFFPHDPELKWADYDYPAMGNAVYRYKGSSDNVIAGVNKPGSEAKVYYEHLGGVRCIRDKVLQRLLPANAGFTPECPAETIDWPPAPPLTECPGDETYRGTITGNCCDYGVSEGAIIKPDNPYYIRVGDPQCNLKHCSIQNFFQKEAPFGDYPEFCYYCNTPVCLRKDGVGGCAGMCNWQCCQQGG